MNKVLIANRGEIACRVIRSCRALGLQTVAVYSEADADALHVRLADECRLLGAAPATESYLHAERILAAARETGADALHPGYGFLSENPRFAEAVEAAGLIWVGPRAKTIEDMGDKERARMLAAAAGIPVLPGSARFAPGDLDGIEASASEVGYPLLVKAAAGGGGIGLRRVEAPEHLRKMVAATQATAAQVFGDGSVYLERYVARARHVEVQIFGMGDGEAVHLYERDCSVQRRFQKLVEESPAPALPEGVREEMYRAALALAHRERYRGAGTVEFIWDEARGAFYFLEMNTRIQVEHPVTEMRTGMDLVALQLKLQLTAGAQGLTLKQSDIVAQGHSMECRLYAENPAKRFMPSPGVLEQCEFPEPHAGLRIDTGVERGSPVSHYYDPLIAKLVSYGDSRAHALRIMLKALDSVRIEGVHTNKTFLMRVLSHPAFQSGAVHTQFVDEHATQLLSSPASAESNTQRP